MKKRRPRKPAPLTHARVIRMSPRRRMALTIKDMPKYMGRNLCTVGETSNYYLDGRVENRRQRGGKL